MGNFAKFADKDLCVSTELRDLLSKSPVGMADSKINQADFSAVGSCYRYRLQFWGICLVNMSVKMIQNNWHRRYEKSD